jgi:hypothetical protein
MGFIELNRWGIRRFVRAPRTRLAGPSGVMLFEGMPDT